MPTRATETGRLDDRSGDGSMPFHDERNAAIPFSNAEAFRHALIDEGFTPTIEAKPIGPRPNSADLASIASTPNLTLASLGDQSAESEFYSPIPPGYVKGRH
jgi:hypothetical protein